MLIELYVVMEVKYGFPPVPRSGPLPAAQAEALQATTIPQTLPGADIVLAEVRLDVYPAD